MNEHAERMDFSHLQAKIDRAINKLHTDRYYGNQVPVKDEQWISPKVTRPTLRPREPVYEEIKDLKPPSTFSQPDTKKPSPHYHFEVQKDQAFGFTSNVQPEKEKPTAKSKHEEEVSKKSDQRLEEWSKNKYLGPRFPSLSPPRQAPKDAERAEVENLRQLAAEELDNISRLEGDICVELYGTRANQGQCSVLENNHVVAATQYPNLLARDVKTRITLMNDVQLRHDVHLLSHHHYLYPHYQQQSQCHLLNQRALLMLLWQYLN